MSNNNSDTNQIGLEKADMSEIIAKLNSLLSSYHTFYINVRVIIGTLKVSTSSLYIQSSKSYILRCKSKLMKSLNVF